ncbi:MAG TPA: hypothetical protein DCP52_03970 [Elusimicrobia bacterium]|nr:hypothetical protein [Elusimicrobiota bacterium]
MFYCPGFFRGFLLRLLGVIPECFYPGSVVFVVAVSSFILKGLSSFFFVKILINRGGYTRMYPLYKNAYKRPF